MPPIGDRIKPSAFVQHLILANDHLSSHLSSQLVATMHSQHDSRRKLQTIIDLPCANCDEWQASSRGRQAEAYRKQLRRVQVAQAEM
jgi:hypothetical protein